jgi:preprotein translocase subunit SecG
MHTALIVAHYFICAFLVILILLQAGKGADIGAAFGGASNTVFGGRGPATFLSKITSVAAILFLITSISLAQFSKQRTVTSVIDTTTSSSEGASPVEQSPPPAPVAPATPVQTDGKK